MQAQIEIPGIPAPERKELVLSPLALMEKALEHGQVEQLQILQDMHFKQMARDAEIEFNEAMNAIQAEIGRVAPNLTNPQTRSKYASYDKLDAVLRPLYTRHGFSLSFSDDDSQKADHIRIICYVSHRSGHTRMYRKDMPVVTTGIKGNEMMTLTHATSSADSYAKRYLVKDIFNIAIGEEDDDGNGAQPKSAFTVDDYDELQDRLNYFDRCSTMEELEEHWRGSRAWAKSKKDQSAIDRIDARKDERKAAMKGGKQ